MSRTPRAPPALAAALLLAAWTSVDGARAVPPIPDPILQLDAGPGGPTPDPTAPAVEGATPPRAHAEDVVDYVLRATLDPNAHAVHGVGTIRWRNRSSVPVHELWLHLYLNAFKNERSAFLRERVGGRGSAPAGDYGSIEVRKFSLRDSSGGPPDDLLSRLELQRPGDDDETDARVVLPEEIAPGRSVEIDIAFDDKLPAIIERTGYRGHFHMVGQWFPKVAVLERDGTWAHFPFHHLSEFYADFGTYDVTLDVPAGYTIGATGPVVERSVRGGRLVERHVQADVHDFAWTAWDRWQSAHETIDGVDVVVLFPPGFAAVAERDLAALRFALPYESAHYGAYPYRVLTVVHPQEDAAEAGGMEYPTLITSVGPWFTPPGILAPEIVAVHELGHQWFYGLIATDEASWPFLDEGVDQFAEIDAMAAWQGEGSAAKFLGMTVSDAAIQAVASNQAVHDEPVAQPAASFTTGANYGRLVYSRTAAVLETLSRVYGRDQVAHALGRYARRYRFEHPSPEQFVAAFTEVLGVRPAAALRSALFDEGWIDYTIGPISADSVLVRRRGTLSLPVDVQLFFADGSKRLERWDGEGNSKHITCDGPEVLRGAIVDPDDRILLDANLENNHASVDAHGGGAARTLERVTYWMQLALQAVSP